MGDTTSLGFGHFLLNADIVAKVLLVVLALMSAISWYLIVYKGFSQIVRQRPDVHVVVLTSFSEDENVVAALRAGAAVPSRPR